jgi:protein-tyrosine phosphatase
LIDLHCHILPGIDDGPVDIEESIEMARQAVEDGIHSVVATPHSGNGVYVNTCSDICRQVQTFNRILEDHGVPLCVMPGAEEHFRPEMVGGQDPGKGCTLNDAGMYLLVEFPFMSFPDIAAETLLGMLQAGLTPILAHPERNAAFQKDIDILHALVDAGCLTQITAMSLTGELGEPAMACAYQMIERRLAHVIASDAHSAGSRRPVLCAAVEVAATLLGSRAEALAMVVRTPVAIISGKTVLRRQAVKPRKKWWRGSLHGR